VRSRAKCPRSTGYELSSYDYLTAVAPGGLVLPSDAYTVVGIEQNQNIDGDDLYDVLDIYFTVTDRPGVFSFEIPLVGFRVFESGIDLTSEANIVNALYNIPV
jgi:hypothetical protein